MVTKWPPAAASCGQGGLAPCRHSGSKPWSLHIGSCFSRNQLSRGWSLPLPLSDRWCSHFIGPNESQPRLTAREPGRNACLGSVPLQVV